MQIFRDASAIDDNNMEAMCGTIWCNILKGNYGEASQEIQFLLETLETTNDEDTGTTTSVFSPTATRSMTITNDSANSKTIEFGSKDMTQETASNQAIVKICNRAFLSYLKGIIAWRLEGNNDHFASHMQSALQSSLSIRNKSAAEEFSFWFIFVFSS